ncbi:MAG: dockerin type I domain-containing protein, partial [Nanoarchaeota archaeon]
DFYLRSSHINISKAHYPDWVSDARFFTQHLVIVNISDQFNLTGACSVQVLDNGVLPRLEGIDAKLKTLANPTAKVYIPTGETGRGQEWITEKLIYAKSSSPPIITEYDFSNYTLTTKGWGSENYSQITLNLTNINSVVYVDFKINTSLGKTQLPGCTASQMLDLNNDENVNILDATIVLRYIAGLPVSSAGTKECAGISLNAF